VNLKNMSKEEWYSAMAVLFQNYEPYLFTAKESISISEANLPMDQEKIRNSAIYSGADEFISMWQGSYDQQLGSEFGGITPSQGQEQKIAIARVLYKNSYVLVLDEPTASVDALSEAAIFERIRQSTGDRTVILISHRFNTVINMDRIVVVEHGTVVEEGSHSDLVKIDGGVYAKMFKSQASAYVESGEKSDTIEAKL
jgi:ATP-binding cassette subfamily B protein